MESSRKESRLVLAMAWGVRFGSTAEAEEDLNDQRMCFHSIWIREL